MCANRRQTIGAGVKKMQTSRIPRPRHPQPAVSTAGMRADRVGPLGVPIPDRESVSEAFHWLREHQQ